MARLISLLIALFLTTSTIFQARADGNQGGYFISGFVTTADGQPVNGVLIHVSGSYYDLSDRVSGAYGIDGYYEIFVCSSCSSFVSPLFSFIRLTAFLDGYYFAPSTTEIVDISSDMVSNFIATKIKPDSPPACRDGIDNDNDGRIDYPNDPGCSSADDTTETNSEGPDCDDGIDNDADGKIDMLDPDCESPSDDSEGPKISTCDGTVDKCGVCDGKNECLDCAGVPFGTSKLDCCGVCGGNGTSCLDDCHVYNVAKTKTDTMAQINKLYSMVNKYSKDEIKCDKSKQSAANKRISEAKALVLASQKLLSKYNTATVKVCDTPYCEKSSFLVSLAGTKKSIDRLHKLARNAQYAAGRACHAPIRTGATVRGADIAKSQAINSLKKMPAYKCNN